MRLLFNPNRRRIIGGTLLSFTALLLTTPSVFANGSLTLSKRADFSTNDQNFTRQDVLHLRVVDASLDFNDIKDNEFRLKPNSGGDDVEGSFINHLNGTYTAKVQLSTLASSETQWEVRVKIKDDDGNEFEERVNIIITADDSDDDEDVQVRGTITQLGANSLTVDNRKIFVDAATKILDDRGLGISFNDLRVGQTVEVKAERRNDGNLWALTIKIEDRRGDDDEVEIRGRIKAIATNHIVIMQFAFFVDAETIILDHRNNAISFADLQVGQLVEVRADRQADGSLLATRIKIEDEVDDEIELTGAITSIGANNLVVSNLKFSVNRNTIILDNQNNPIRFTDLRVGQIVEIRADRQADGTLLATRIKIEDLPNDEVEVRGFIEALDNNTLVVLNLKFFVDNNTVVLDNRNNPIRFADLQLGQLVQIRANRRADGTLLAKRIKLEDLPNDEVELTGAIETIDSSSLVVLGRKFVVNQNTVILDNNNNPIRFADLRVGQIVEVRADRQPDGTLLATRIKIEDLPDDEVEVTGAISSLGENSLVVLGLKFVVNASTVILDNNNNAIRFADLRAGLIVEIRADRQADGTLLATKIKIEDRMSMSGAVATVDRSGLSVAGIAVTFDSNTSFRDQNNRPLTSQDLRAGELVEVQTAQPAANSLVALTVKKAGVLTTVTNDQSSSSGLPETFELKQNYPNPFNPSTTVRFIVPANLGAQQVVTLRIYNVMGQLVRTLVNGSFASGSYIAVWNGENEAGVKVSTGVYFYELSAGNFTAMKRMILAK